MYSPCTNSVLSGSELRPHADEWARDLKRFPLFRKGGNNDSGVSIAVRTPVSAACLEANRQDAIPKGAGPRTVVIDGDPLDERRASNRPGKRSVTRQPDRTQSQRDHERTCHENLHHS